MLLLAFVRFRQLPSSSVSLRGIPPKLDMRGGGPGAKAPGPLFSLNAFSSSIGPILASVSFRQLPWASVGFRGLPYSNILFNPDNMTGGRGPGGKVPHAAV